MSDARETQSDAAAAPPAEDQAGDSGSRQQTAAQGGRRGSLDQGGSLAKPGRSKKGKGGRNRAKIVDISQPPQFSESTNGAAAGVSTAAGSTRSSEAGGPAAEPAVPLERKRSASAGAVRAGEGSGDRPEPSPRNLREFWEQETRKGTHPRPRTPQKQGAATSSGARQEEAAICDRLGTPVLSLRVPSGITRALASVDTFGSSLPSLARLREAAAAAGSRVGFGAAAPSSAPAAVAPIEAGLEAAEKPGAASATEVARDAEGADQVPKEVAAEGHSSAAEPAAADEAEQAVPAEGKQDNEYPAGLVEVSARLQANQPPQRVDSALEDSTAELIEASPGHATEPRASPDSQPGQPSPATRADSIREDVSVAEDQSAALDTRLVGAAAGEAEGGSQAEAAEAACSGDSQSCSPEEETAGDRSAAGAAGKWESQADGPGSHTGRPAAELEEPVTPSLAAAPVLESYQRQATLDLGGASASGSGHASMDGLSSAVATSEPGSVDGSEAIDDAASSVQHEPAEAAADSASLPVFPAIQRSATAAESSGRGSDEDPAWRAQAKHIFVLSNAGKPIFTLHGEENKLAGFMAVIHAMMSFAADRGDGLRSLRAGAHRVVFLVRGPLYLVAVAATGEPAQWLEAQLQLLHAQLLCILTSGFERMFSRNPRFDARRLLGGTGGVLRALIAGFVDSPWALLNAFPPIPLRPELRHECLTSLQTAVKASGSLYGLLLVGGKVGAIAQSRAHPFAQSDLLVVANFVTASASFRQSPESFTPVCLPAFNPAGFLHAYVQYLHLEARICLVLLSPDQNSFHSLSKTARGMKKAVGGSIKEVAAAVADGAGLSVCDLPEAAGGGRPGQTPLLHFAYKSPARGQVVAPRWSGPLLDAAFRQEIMAAYAGVHTAMFPSRDAAGGLGPPTRRIHYEQSNRCTLLAVASAEYELYAAFDALTTRGHALDICQKLAAWVKREQASLFIPV